MNLNHLAIARDILWIYFEEIKVMNFAVSFIILAVLVAQSFAPTPDHSHGFNALRILKELESKNTFFYSYFAATIQRHVNIL